MLSSSENQTLETRRISRSGARCAISFHRNRDPPPARVQREAQLPVCGLEYLAAGSFLSLEFVPQAAGGKGQGNIQLGRARIGVQRHHRAAIRSFARKDELPRGDLQLAIAAAAERRDGAPHAGQPANGLREAGLRRRRRLEPGDRRSERRVGVRVPAAGVPSSEP